MSGKMLPISLWCAMAGAGAAADELAPSPSRPRTRPEPPGETPPIRFRGGLVSKAHRFLYHSTLGLRVMKKKKKKKIPIVHASHCREHSAQLRQSRPDAGIVLSHCAGERLETLSNFSLPLAHHALQTNHQHYHKLLHVSRATLKRVQEFNPSAKAGIWP